MPHGVPTMKQKKSLRTDAIAARPVDFDWSKGIGERWELVYPDPEKWTDKYRREWWGEHSTGEGADDDEAAELDALRDLIQENPSGYEPMMSYYYPLPGFDGDASAAQATLDNAGVGACIVAEVDGAAVLALAGGGMDLSWDICRAYIALGYYPPVHYAGKLPKMAGESDTATAAVCLEACRIRQRWAGGDTRDARSVLKWARDQKGVK